MMIYFGYDIFAKLSLFGRKQGRVGPLKRLPLYWIEQAHIVYGIDLKAA